MAKNKPRVNIIITADSIRYGYQKVGGVSELLDSGEVMLPAETLKNGEIINPEQFKSTIESIIKDKSKKRNWKGRQLAFALIDDTVFIERIRIPGYVSEKEAIDYIRVQDGVKLNIPFEDSALSVNLLNYDTTAKQTELIYYAYPLDKYNRFKSLFVDAGLRPIIGDLTGPSVFRYFVNSVRQESGENVVIPKHVLITQWNRSGVYISTFNHTNVVFSRHIKTELKNPDTASKADVLDTIHRIAVQIDRIVEFYHTSVMSHDDNDGENKRRRGGTRRATQAVSDEIKDVVVSGDFPYMHLVKSELEAILGLKIHDFPEHGQAESVETGRKDNKKTDRQTDAWDVGKHGRSTRMTSFALEQSRNISDKDKMQSQGAKFIDLYGLSLKDIPKPNPDLVMPKIVKVKKPKKSEKKMK